MEENLQRVTQELKQVNDKFATIRASNNVVVRKATTT